MGGATMSTTASNFTGKSHLYCCTGGGLDDDQSASYHYREVSA